MKVQSPANGMPATSAPTLKGMDWIREIPTTALLRLRSIHRLTDNQLKLLDFSLSTSDFG